MDSPDHGRLDPEKSREILEQHFSSESDESVVARALQMVPRPRSLEDDGLGLAQMVGEVSWKVMQSLEAPTRQSTIEVMAFARDVCDHLDEAASLVSTYELGLRDTEQHWGVQAKRMLVSQGPGVRRVLGALVASSKYKGIRADVQTLSESATETALPQLEEIRQFFATLALMLEEA